MASENLVCWQHFQSSYHQVNASFQVQLQRLLKAGFPLTLLSNVAEQMMATLISPQKQTKEKDPHRSTVVTPYVHKVSHNLKKVAQKAGVKIVFSARHKVSSLCKKIGGEQVQNRCKNKHA